MLQPQQILQERYCLKEQLGRTGLGRQSWLAVDLQSAAKEPVMIKLLAFNPQMRWEDVKLFERESQVLQNLNHPQIPRYRDHFAIDGQAGEGLPWFALVQEYIPGQSLQTLLDRGNSFSENQIIQLAQDILGILVYLHELSPPVFHRDLKPSNLILGTNQQIYLVDFGAVQDRAKAEGASFTVVGTSGYAAPEQLWGKTVAASDLYALGATLVHLMTGITPSELPQRNLRIQFRDRLALTPWFAQWLGQLLDPVLERRFKSARQALEALESMTISALNAQASHLHRAQYGRLAQLSLLGLTFGGVAVFLFVKFALPLLGKILIHLSESKARCMVAQMNEAEMIHFSDQSKFPDSSGVLEIKPPLQIENYSYSVRKTNNAVINYAISRRKTLRSFVGGVIVVGNSSAAFICEAAVPSTERPPSPNTNNPLVPCPTGTRDVTPVGDRLFY